MSAQVEATWAQIEVGADAHAGVIARKREIAEATLTEEARIRSIKEATWPQVLKERAELVFGRLGIVDALKAVRDEKWGGEGEITAVGRRDPYHSGGERFEYILTLASDPIPRIAVRGGAGDRSLRVQTYEVPTKLEVGVLFKSLSIIDNLRVVYVSDPRLDPVPDKMPDVKALIRDRGLEQLPELLRGYGEWGENYREEMDYEGYASKDEFYYYLREAVNSRTERGTLPGQLRARHEVMIGKFPDQLKMHGVMEYPALRKWQHDQRGTKRWIVWCEQRMGFSA